MRSWRNRARLVAAATLLVCSSATAVVAGTTSRVGADTPSDSLVGEGGSFLAPVVSALENADPSQAAPYFGYQDTDIDSGVADFTGTAAGAAGQLNADFAVTERPLTSAESAGALANGRTFAYVPFAATPVAIVDLAFCGEPPQPTEPVVPQDWCQDVPLTPKDIVEILQDYYGVDVGSDPIENWGNLPQANGDPIPSSQSFGWANVLGHQEENTALLSFIESDPVANAELENILADSQYNVGKYTEADIPAEEWPLQTISSTVGGDLGMIESEMDISPTDDAPADAGQWNGLGARFTPLGSGDAFPVSSVWTGSPQGTPWNLPTAALENAAGAFVPPTEAAAEEAQTGTNITLDATTNLVTFNASKTDQTTYNSLMMAESYLVVPTAGLPQAKADKLAQFIRFVLGPEGQTVISQFGAAPATPAEVSAGLDVAAELSQEAAFDKSQTSTSTTSTSTTSTSTTSTTGSTTATSTTTSTTTGSTGSTSTSSTAGSGSTGSGSSASPAGTTSGVGTGVVAAESSPSSGGSGGSSTGLAFTGTGVLLPMVGIGATLASFGAIRRRRYRRRMVTV